MFVCLSVCEKEKFYDLTEKLTLELNGIFILIYLDINKCLLKKMKIAKNMAMLFRFFQNFVWIFRSRLLLYRTAQIFVKTLVKTFVDILKNNLLSYFNHNFRDSLILNFESWNYIRIIVGNTC